MLTASTLLPPYLLLPDIFFVRSFSTSRTTSYIHHLSLDTTQWVE